MTRLRRSQAVRLNIDGLGDVSARVQDAADGRLALVLSVDLELPVESLAHRHAQVEFATAGGLYRLDGDVVRPGAGGVVELTIDHEERIQRRDDARVQVVRPVSLLVDGDPLERDATTVDLSGGGLLIAGPATLGVGDRLSFALDLDRAAVGGAGHIVRETQTGHKGVRIDRISSRERELLVRFVFASQLRLRSQGLT